MKKRKLITGITVAIAACVALIAADHIEAPAVTGGTTDITDVYAFQAENPDNVVLVANLQGLLSPGGTAAAAFDENAMIEFNIDTNSDAVEDFVIQAIPRGDTMYFFGPFAPTSTGLTSSVNVDAVTQSEVKITSYLETAFVGTNAGMSFFAGPRDDPFFMDFARYTQIIAGVETEFADPGSDTFAGTNVLSVVVEMPKAMIGGSGSVTVWVTSNRKI